MNKRIQWVDGLRGFAILLVVMGHVGQFTFCLDMDKSIMKLIYSFHMPLFFFISGMFFRYIELKRFVIKKTKAILQPWIIFTILPAIIKGNGLFEYGWFLPTLFIVSIYQYLVLYFTRICKANNIYGIIIFSFLGWIILCLLYYGKVINFPFMLHTIRYFLFFSFGLLFMDPLFSRLFDNKIIQSVCLLSVIPMFIYYDSICKPVHFIAFPIILLLVNLFKNTKCFLYMDKIGDKTLEIYLLHGLFIPQMIIGQSLNRIIDNNFTIQLFLILILSIFIILICLVCIIIIRESNYANKILFGKY